MRVSKLSTFSAILIGALGAAVPAFAANGTWSADSSGNWSDTGNWAGGIIPDDSSSTASFTNDITATRTVTLDSARTVAGLTFSDNGALGSQWVLQGPGTLTLQGASAAFISGVTPVTISATILGSQPININGSNKLVVLTGTNGYTGATNLFVGNLRAIDGQGLPTASNLTFISPGSSVLESSGTFTRKLGSAAGQVRWSSPNSGGFAAFGGTLDVSLTNASDVVGGQVTWASGGFVSAIGQLILGSVNADNVVDFKNPIALGTSTRTVSVPDNTSSTADRAVLSGALTGTGNLTKSGGGILALTAANGYNNTTVNAGALLANNASGSATGSGNVAVNGGTFGGTGAISGSVSVAGGATLSPGDSGIESLDVGSVTLTAATSHFATEIDLTAVTADLLNVTGGVTLTGSTLDLSLLNQTFGGLPKTFLLIQNDGSGDGISGVFDTINVLAGFTATPVYNFSGVDALGRSGNGNDFAVTISAVPEPTSLGLLALGAAGLVLRRRRRVE